MINRLENLRAEHLDGTVGGITAVCSAHPDVLACALAQAAAGDSPLLVEATANQVNQFGGYTGMRPEDFVAHVRSLCGAAGLPPQRLFIGADHLGPHPWRKESARRALARAGDLAAACATAGFQKFHLDTGIACADDPGPHLPVEVAAERAVYLCRATESAVERMPADRTRPLYVIGAEVPLPGGALDDPATLEVTAPEAVLKTVATFGERFIGAGLEGAWTRVLAVVVQPGVEFGDVAVAGYDPEKAAALSAVHARLPGIMTYEVHAADYQSPAALSLLIRDHFTVLKVGPCLTNAFREAVFALADIEAEWLGQRRGVSLSHIRDVLENAMLLRPQHWQSHYRGRSEEQRYQRSYSLRDRVRYYWSFPEVEQSLARLFANLAPDIPTALLHQYFPDLCPIVFGGEIVPPNPKALIRGRIQKVLAAYFKACGGTLSRP